MYAPNLHEVVVLRRFERSFERKGASNRAGSWNGDAFNPSDQPLVS
jgi:hypothetical protein